jgi:hypothetical protein
MQFNILNFNIEFILYSSNDLKTKDISFHESQFFISMKSECFVKDIPPNISTTQDISISSPYLRLPGPKSEFELATAASDRP